MAQKFAKWVRTRSGRDTRYELRAGRKGTGQALGQHHTSVLVWHDSPKSLEAADPYLARLEEDAIAAGYTVLPEDES